MFARAVANAKLIVLPGIGHMIQNAVPDLVVAETEAMARVIVPARKTAGRSHLP
jgi:pimeloyl-ACP methyl ester carboxylesterase